MKVNVFVSYKMICSVILIIVSIILLIISGVSLFKFYNAIEYKNSSLKKGEYVVCEIQDYLVKPIDEYNSNVYSGQCEVVSTFFKDYYVYNIPYGNDMYVRVKICERISKYAFVGWYYFIY